MTGQSPPPADPPADVDRDDALTDALDRDDALLDALGRDEPLADGDRVTAMLAAWRADVAGPATLVRSAVPAPEPAGSAPGTAIRPLPAQRPVPVRRHWATRRRLAVAAAVVVLAGGGTAAAAATTNPHSPLWPISRLLYPQRAERVTAEDTLTQARQAIEQGRRDDAARLLNQADAQIAQVDAAADRARLRQELEALRLLLLGAVTGASPAAPGATAPNPPSGAPPATGGPGPTPGPLPSLLPPSLLPPSLLPPLPTGLLPTSLLPTSLLPPLPGLGH